MMWKQAIALSCAFLAAGGLTGCGETTGVPHREGKAAGASSETHMVKKDGKAIVVFFLRQGIQNVLRKLLRAPKGWMYGKSSRKNPIRIRISIIEMTTAASAANIRIGALCRRSMGMYLVGIAMRRFFWGIRSGGAKHRILCIILCGVMTFPESRSFLSAHRIPVILETAMCC